MFARLMFVVFCLYPALVSAQQSYFVNARIDEFSAGVYCESHDALSHRPQIDDLVETGSYVPAELGMSFGIKFSANDPDISSVRFVFTHPPMGPFGTTEHSYINQINATENGLMLHQFSSEEELVHGTWTFTAMHEGEILFTSSFNVVPPEMIPELTRACKPNNLIG